MSCVPREFLPAPAYDMYLAKKREGAARGRDGLMKGKEGMIIS